MGILDGVISALTGGTSDGVTSLGTGLINAVEKYFPPSMTAEQKANIQLAADNFALQKEAQLSSLAIDAEKEVDARIAMYEGTATDLKSIPILGPFMLFLRGAQRPIWGFVMMYFDYGVFSGMWKLTDPMISNAFWILNFLILGFLFGERAVMNVMPFITNMIATRNQAGGDVSITTIKK